MEQAITPLNERVVKIKILLNQTAQNIIEIGKELTAAKAEVPHGEWQNWLADNFSLSKSTANNFMRCAERFGNFQTSGNLNPSQMVEMLALPAEDTEKFIEEKVAQGTPVDEMTVKKLREEVAQYKLEIQQKERNLEASKNEYERLQSAAKDSVNRADKAEKQVQSLFEELDSAKAAAKLQKSEFQRRYAELQQVLKNANAEIDTLKNQPPQIVEPQDYQQLKKSQIQLQNKIAALQKELDNKTVEVVTPADYESTKKELAELKAAEVEMVQRMDVYQKLDTVASLMPDIMASKSLQGILTFKREHAEEFKQMCTYFLDFTDSFYKE